MIGLSFLKRKPRQFNYEPRYYDPKKEEREIRQRALGITDEENQKDAKYVPGSYIRSQRVKRILSVDVEPKKNQKLKVALVRFAIAMILLLLFGYFIISFNGIEALLTK